MEQNLKQRLVGAVVLISLAVIFLPLVFDGQQERINIEKYAIPEKPSLTIESPDIKPIEHQAKAVLDSIAEVENAKKGEEELGNTMGLTDTLPTPEQKSGSSKVEIPEPAYEQVKEHIAKEREHDQQVKKQGKDAPLKLADAWVIQVGAFSSKANANGLRDQLNKAGYNAYTKSAAGLFKVYVGPEVRKYRLEQQKTRLEKEFSLKTMILKYIP